MTEYLVRDENGEETFEAEDEASARAWVEHWLRSGDWDVSDGTTIWVHAHLFEAESGERVDRIEVRIDPPEPKCSDANGHDWQAPHLIVGGLCENPGVFANAGGVVIREVCMHCGCGRVTDTWARNPSTGEQGLESVVYEPGKYTDEIRG